MGSSGGLYWWQRRERLVPLAKTTADLEIEASLQRLGQWIGVAAMRLRGLYGAVWFCDRDAGREVSGILLGIERGGRDWSGVSEVAVEGFTCGWSGVAC